MRITIRNISEEDIPQVVDIQVEGWRIAYKGIIDDEFLEKAKNEDMCYVETDDLHAYEEQISKIILYRWNRDYPADLYFKIDLMNGNWDMISTCDFEGSSHKVITKEVWVKRCF